MARSGFRNLGKAFPTPRVQERPTAAAQREIPEEVRQQPVQEVVVIKKREASICTTCQDIFFVKSNYVDHMRDVHSIEVEPFGGHNGLHVLKQGDK